MKKEFLHKKVEILLFLGALIFSIWLNFKTFSADGRALYIAQKAWSDFSSQIPLIRSFSLGDNFPPEYPVFSGSPIHYHFVFYAFVGLLERLGIPIDYALNIPSAAGFALLILLIYLLAKKLFKSTTVGLLSVLFFFFNGSLSFLYFFNSHPLSLTTVSDIIKNNTFPSFGPYGPGIVSAFWNLNIYTNQRHLAASFAFALFVIFVFYFILPKYDNTKRYILSIALGILIGLSFFFHIAVFIMILLTLGTLSLLSKRFKDGLIVILPALIVFLPQYSYLNSGGSSYAATLTPGYLIASNLTIASFIKYWVANLGLHFFLIPAGLLLSDKRLRVFFLSVFSSFLIANLFQFSPEIAGNHKFINFFMIFGVMFSAFFIEYLWKTNKLSKIVITVVVFFLVFSGIIDFFPVANDVKGSLADYKSNPVALWISENTPRNSTFFNTNYLYDTASLAGRKIFMGWPYFAWSAGYDTTARSAKIKEVLASNSKERICDFMKQNQLDYFSATQPGEDFPYNSQVFEKGFHTVYKSPDKSTVIYDRKTSCP